MPTCALGEVSRSVRRGRAWADAINRAGQLRMLSQRLVRLAAQAPGRHRRAARRASAHAVDRARAAQPRSSRRPRARRARRARRWAGVRGAWQALEAALAARLRRRAARRIDAAGRGAAAGRRGPDRGARGRRRAARAADRQPLRPPAHARAAARQGGAARALPMRQRPAGRRRWTSSRPRCWNSKRAPLSSPEIRDRAGGRARRMAAPAARRARRRQRRGPASRWCASSDALVDTFEQLTAAVRAQPAGHHVLTPGARVAPSATQAATFSTWPGACRGSRAPPCGSARSARSSASSTRSRGRAQVDAQDLADRRRRAVGHHHDAVRQQHRLVDVVRDHHHRAAACLRDDLQQLVLQVRAGQRVERAERLVQQQHLGLHRQRARDADALLHAARDLVRAACARRGVMPTSSSAAWVRAFSCALLSVAAEHALDREIDVLEAGQPGQQRMVLEHHAALRARAGDLAVGAAAARRSVGCSQAGDQVEQRRLAAARVADQRDELALARPSGRCRAARWKLPLLGLEDHARRSATAMKLVHGVVSGSASS